MKKILINFAHPYRSKSRINKAMLKAVEGLEGVTVNDLYEEYPDLYINVKKEQQLLMDHDVIVFQYPFYWYSTPSILKEWQDVVLEHGFAYGSKGKFLEGKEFLIALTAGLKIEDYSRDGSGYFTIEELNAPLKAMAKLCRMDWLSPFAVTGVGRNLAFDKVSVQAENYRRRIIEIRDNDSYITETERSND